jgi:hypothetical protein
VDNYWSDVLFDGFLEGLWLFSLVILVDLADVCANWIRRFLDRKRVDA